MRKILAISLIVLFTVMPIIEVSAQENIVERVRDSLIINEAENYEVLPIVSDIVDTSLGDRIYTVIHDKLLNSIVLFDRVYEVKAELRGDYGIVIPLDIEPVRLKNGTYGAFEIKIPDYLEGTFNLFIKVKIGKLFGITIPILETTKRITLMNFAKARHYLTPIAMWKQRFTLLRDKILANYENLTNDVVRLGELANIIDIPVYAPDSLRVFKANALILNESDKLYYNEFKNEILSLNSSAQIMNITIEDFINNYQNYKGWYFYIAGDIHTNYDLNTSKYKIQELLDKAFSNYMTVIAFTGARIVATDGSIMLYHIINNMIDPNITMEFTTGDVYPTSYYMSFAKYEVFENIQDYAIAPHPEMNALFQSGTHYYAGYLFIGGSRIALVSEKLVDSAESQGYTIFYYIAKGRINDANVYSKQILTFLDKLIGFGNATGIPFQALQRLKNLRDNISESLNGTIEGIEQATRLIQDNSDYFITALQCYIDQLNNINLGTAFGDPTVSVDKNLFESLISKQLINIPFYAGIIIDGIKNLRAGLIDKNNFTKILEKARDGLAFHGVILNITGSLSDLTIRIGNKVYGITNMTLESIFSMIQTLQKLLNEIIKTIMNGIKNVLDNLAGNIADALNDFIGGINNVISKIEGYMKYAGVFIGFAVGGKIGSIISNLVGLLGGGGVLSSFTDLSSVAEYLSDLEPASYVDRMPVAGELVGGIIGGIAGYLLTDWYLLQHLRNFLDRIKNLKNELIGYLAYGVASAMEGSIMAITSALNTTINTVFGVLKIIVAKVKNIADQITNTLNKVIDAVRNSVSITNELLFNVIGNFTYAIRQVANFTKSFAPRVFEAMGDIFNSTLYMFRTLEKGVSTIIGNFLTEMTAKIENWVMKKLSQFASMLNERFRAISNAFRTVRSSIATIKEELTSSLSALFQFLDEFILVSPDLFNKVIKIWQNPTAFFSNISNALNEVYDIKTKWYKIESFTGIRIPAIDNELEKLYLYLQAVKYARDFKKALSYSYSALHLWNLIGMLLFLTNYKAKFGQGFYTTYNITDLKQVFTNGTEEDLPFETLELEDGQKIYFAKPQITDSLLVVNLSKPLFTAEGLTIKQEEDPYLALLPTPPNIQTIFYKIFNETVITGLRALMNIDYPKMIPDHMTTAVSIKVNAIGGNYTLTVEVGVLHYEMTVNQGEEQELRIPILPIAQAQKIRVFLNGKLILEDWIIIIPSFITIFTVIFIATVIYYIRKKRKKKKKSIRIGE